MEHIIFLRREIKDIIIAWAVISLALGMIIVRDTGITLANIIAAVIIAALTAGIGFVAHELSHKITAQRFRCQAEFRKDSRMLVFAIAVSLLGFLFAAPGGVRITGRLTRKQEGIIAASGPFANFVIAGIFLLLPLGTIATYGFMINAWLGVFNIMPLPGFDGKKILGWSKAAFGIMVFLGIIINIPLFL